MGKLIKINVVIFIRDLFNFSPSFTEQRTCISTAIKRISVKTGIERNAILEILILRRNSMLPPCESKKGMIKATVFAIHKTFLFVKILILPNISQISFVTKKDKRIPKTK